jgi:hypothetical protein
LSEADSSSCLDVDECSEADDVCRHGDCVNLPGSHRCECHQGKIEKILKLKCNVLEEWSSEAPARWLTGAGSQEAPTLQLGLAKSKI